MKNSDFINKLAFIVLSPQLVFSCMETRGDEIENIMRNEESQISDILMSNNLNRNESNSGTSDDGTCLKICCQQFNKCCLCSKSSCRDCFNVFCCRIQQNNETDFLENTLCCVCPIVSTICYCSCEDNPCGND